jgi:hypothetical protein
MGSLMACDLLLQGRNFLGFGVSGACKSCCLSHLHLDRYRISDHAVKKGKYRSAKYILGEHKEFIQLRDVRFTTALKCKNTFRIMASFL